MKRFRAALKGFVAFKKCKGLKYIPENAIAYFAEEEGATVIVPSQAHKDAFAWIVIENETALTDLGITAKFSTALSNAGIPCNVFAPIHHDHIFVPYLQAEKAAAVINDLEMD